MEITPVCFLGIVSDINLSKVKLVRSVFTRDVQTKEQAMKYGMRVYCSAVHAQLSAKQVSPSQLVGASENMLNNSFTYVAFLPVITT